MNILPDSIIKQFSEISLSDSMEIIEVEIINIQQGIQIKFIVKFEINKIQFYSFFFEKNKGYNNMIQFKQFQKY